ncbi:MAG: adenylyltransferase/cytidyltransferase family protein [Candidatus Heimdallarchaeaceae archaeon]|jgi:glycerol-3-phosphate cytidylyltransferase/FAD synthetase
MTGTIEHLILKTVYSNSINKVPSTIQTITRLLGLSSLIIEPILENLLSKDSIISDSEGKYSLTSFGRKQLTVVLTGGTFDLLHSGHLFTFEQAKFLGDVLVVVMATDKTVEKEKNRKPSKTLEERARVVGHIKEVDAVVLGSELDFMDTVNFVQPDIIALGYDQYHDEKNLYETLSKNGHSHVKIVRLKEYIPGKSTTKILQDIIKHNYRFKEENN